MEVAPSCLLLYCLSKSRNSLANPGSYAAALPVVAVRYSPRSLAGWIDVRLLID